MENIKAELKAVKINERLSEETWCYSANLYVNGRKAAECSNYGHGGPDNIQVIDKDLFSLFETYCASLPTKKDTDEDEFEYTVDVESYIGELLNDYMKVKSEEKNKKRMERMCKHSIVYAESKDSEYVNQIKYTVDIDKLLNSKHAHIIIDKVKELRNEGFYVFNTNIP